jgi:LysM repeat protein
MNTTIVATRVRALRVPLAALAFAFLLFLLTTLPASAQTYVTVVVQPGDTLSKIAARYCTDWQTIYNINYQAIGPDPNNVPVGTVLTVPNYCSSTPPSSGSGNYPPRTHATGAWSPPYYTVAWGDTLYSVAARFNTTVSKIRADNGLTSDVINPGQVLIIYPGSSGGGSTPPPQQPPPSGGSGLERIQFAPGAIAASTTGTISQGQPKSYVLWAAAGQNIEIWTNSHGEPLYVTLAAPNGQQVFLNGTNSSLSNYLFGPLSYSGDYKITVSPVTQPESPSLVFDMTVGIR